MPDVKPLARRVALAAALVSLALPRPAGAQDTLRAETPPATRPTTIGTDADDRERVAQIRGARPSAGYLLRSPSSRIAPLPGDRGAVRWAPLPPELFLTWNSSIPFSHNDGAVWAGKGLSAWAVGGARLEWGPLFAVLAPQVGMTQNRSFDPLLPDTLRNGRLTPPWYTDETSADLPVRFGEGSRWTVDPGQSTVGLRLRGIDLGASTESQWWGPGVRNAIVMSNNAPGIPHLFVRTASPWRTRAGSVEAKLLLGVLRESEFFDTTSANDHRSLSGLVATFSPAAEPGLTLGVARTVQAAVDGPGSALPRAADAFTRWSGPEEPAAGDERSAQIFSLFGRWIFPRDGLEVWAEWARHELPEDFGDFLDYPNHSQGYTLGLQWAGRVRGPDGLLRLQSELTYLEQSPTFRVRPVQPYYTSAVVPQGYTHGGQVIGAAIGPGASSQWVAADYLAPAGRVGLFLGRIRWDNDAYLTTPRALTAGWSWLGHDVSLLGGVRGGFRLPGFQVDAELTTATRYNYLYQNRARSWQTADDAVDVRNHTLRLSFTPLPPRERVAPAPLRLPPPPPERLDSIAVSVAPLPPAAPDTTLAPAQPQPDSASRAPAPAAALTHTVAPGETLFGIARRYGVPVETLRTANRLTSDAIRAGQVLVVPPLP